MGGVHGTETTGKVIEGTSGDDNIMGTDGRDLMYGYAGNDWLIGKAGNDVLIGGPGADKLDGGLGNNTASYAGARSGVVASLVTRTGSAGDAAGDELSEIADIIGSAFADTLIGGAGPNTLVGGAGDDKLHGNELDDKLYVGTGKDLADGGRGVDLVSYRGVGRGVTVDLAAPAANKGEAAGDAYVAIEDVGGTNFADVLYGNALRNHLFGYAGADRLDGRDGPDILVGGPGRDVLIGGGDADTLRLLRPPDGPDTAVDFAPAEGDRFAIDASGFGGTLKAGALPASALVKGSNPVAPSAASVFLYDTDTGRIFFDVDGTGAAPKVALITLVGVPDIDASDFHLF